MNRFLVVSPNWLGDALFTTPSIRALKKAKPDAFIACLASPRVVEVFKKNPDVDAVISLPDKLKVSSLGAYLQAISKIKSLNLETAIFYKNSKSKSALVKWAGVPKNISQSVRAGSVTDKHRTDAYSVLLERIGVKTLDRSPVFLPDQEDEAAARRLLSSRLQNPNESYAVFHIGGNWDLKRWPFEYFLKLKNLLRHASPIPIFLVGAAHEETLASEFIRQAGDSRVFSLHGKTTLGSLAAILKNAKFLVSNDSGPIHLASSQKTPVIALFGPTSPELTGPISQGEAIIFYKKVGCDVPCYFKACDYRVCMELTSPEEVFEKLKKFL